MKGFFCVAILVLSAVYNTSAQTDSVSKARQILKIEQQLMNAMPGDKVTWEKYLDDKFYIIAEDGTGFNKTAFLKLFSPFKPGYSGNIKVIKPWFTFRNDIAVLHYVADEHETIYGQKLHTTYGTEDTWYQQGNSWKLLSSQTFEVPQLPAPVKVSAAVLKNYVGTYNMPGNTSAVISLKNDMLYIQKKNKTEALFPETPNVFFKKSDTRGRKLFVKDTAGNMLMLERRNGNDLVWKRVK